MLRPPALRRAVHAALATTALAVALPSGAAAADAPQRFIGVDLTGARTTDFSPVAISPDGTEILGKLFENRAGDWRDQPVIRNVATGTTTPVLEVYDDLKGASTDLRRVLFSTKRALDPRDTNGSPDFYVWDRPSNTNTLISVDSDGNPFPVDDKRDMAQISGNGNAVVFSLENPIENRPPGEGPFNVYSQWRFDGATGRTTRIAGEVVSALRSIGDEGRIGLTGEGIFVDGKRLGPHPTGGRTWEGAVVSPDGGYLALRTYELESVPHLGATIVGIDLKTGAVGRVKVPDWLAEKPWTLFSIANGGRTAVVGAPYIDGTGRHYAFGRIDHWGNVTRFGGEIPLTRETGAFLLSENGQFAATNLTLAKIGSAALPGTDPVTTSSPKIEDYFEFVDARCLLSALPWLRNVNPKVTLIREARRADLRRPIRGTLKVWKNGKVANDAKILPGQTKSLTVGNRGGFRIEVTMTLSDGTILDGSTEIAEHPEPGCSYW